jgi:methylase of polypeptide subunit release factors
MHDKQPYEAQIDGIDITIGKGVFPSDLGLTTKYLIDTAKKYSPLKALDMGCGSGIIAIALKKMGVPEVWAADIHEPAIESARKNANRHAEYGDIHIVQSDLFENIPTGEKFDLVVFNHPYAPTKNGKGRYGGNGKGGREVIEKFFAHVISHMSTNAKILMPYSEIAGAEHNPEAISRNFNFVSQKVFETADENGQVHIIYEFSNRNI